MDAKRQSFMLHILVAVESLIHSNMMAYGKAQFLTDGLKGTLDIPMVIEVERVSGCCVHLNRHA